MCGKGGRLARVQAVRAATQNIELSTKISGKKQEFLDNSIGRRRRHALVDLQAVSDDVRAYDIVCDIVCDVVYDITLHIVYDIVYDIVYGSYRKIYSACLAAATNLLHFKVSALLSLASMTRFRRISSPSSTEILLGNALP